jgi:TRAP-type C4-dicarboxylate transport system substrate-binding protein
VTSRTYDKIAIEHRQVILAAVAKFVARLEDVGAQADAQLLGGLFEKQGMTMLHPDAKMRADFENAAHESWKAGVVPAPLIEQVRTLLNEYREHEGR